LDIAFSEGGTGSHVTPALSKVVRISRSLVRSLLLGNRGPFLTKSHSSGRSLIDREPGTEQVCAEDAEIALDAGGGCQIV
jgi:hypothetical protein